jgi:thiol:disulfide interchange protein DsbD
MKKWLVSLSLIWLILPSANAQSNETDPLIAKTKVWPYEWSAGQGGNLEIQMNLPKGFHAYEDATKVRILEPDGFQISQPKIEPIIEWYDKFSKKNRRGFATSAILKSHLEAPPRFLINSKIMKVELTYQACSEQYCLFPATKILEVPIRLASVLNDTTDDQIKTMPVETETKETSFFSVENLTQHLGGSLYLGLFFVFIAGILTSFTPCIFPMIPITLAVLGNHSEKRTRLQNFFFSLVYVHGIATTYSLLGLLAASSGNIFGASLGNVYVLSTMCLIFLVMALSMYGLFEIQVPAFVRNRLGAGKSQGGIVGAFFTGMIAGIVASPCVGPVLVAILTYVATSQSKLIGFLYLFTYAMGLGMIFIVLGLSNQFSKLLPRSGAWMNAFKFFLGTLMLSAFYYYLDLLLPSRWFDVALGLGLVSIASIYGAFLNSKDKTILQHLRKGFMLTAFMIGIAYVGLGIFDLRPYLSQSMVGTASINQIQKLNWKPFSEDALNEAVKSQKPVIIDFWAEWCAACHELEENTFTDPRVRALSERFVLLKFDATKDSSELARLKQKYMIQGLPTVLFINPYGVLLKALTLTQFEKPDEFVLRMQKSMN